MAQNMHYHSIGIENGALGGKAGPKQNHNPAGQTLNPTVPCVMSKGLDGSALPALLTEMHTSLSQDGFTPSLQLWLADFS